MIYNCSDVDPLTSKDNTKIKTNLHFKKWPEEMDKPQGHQS